MATRNRRRITDDEVFEKPINTNYLKRAFKYLLPFKKEVIIASIALIISAAASLASPMILKFALDNHIEVNRFDGLWILALAIVAASFISAMGVRYKVRYMNISGRKAMANLRKDLFDHIQNLGLDFFDSRPAGKIMVRVINDVNSLLNLFNYGIVNMLTNILKLVIIIVLMLFLDWKLALIAFCTLPFLILLNFVLRPHIKRTWRKVRRKISNMNGYLHESLAGIKVTQAYVREEENINIFKETNEDIRESWMHAIKLNNLMFPSFDFVATIGTCLIYFFGIHWMYPADGINPLSLGTLIAMTWYLGRFWEPLNELSNIYTQLLVAMASLERIFEIMDQPIKIKGGNEELPPIEGNVQFKNVTFGYSDEQVVLDDISFNVKKGQSVAFVGPTGAGKSTIINLVSRFYDVREGEVMIDGHNVKDYDLHQLRTEVGVMLQDTFIFSGTLMDNIRYGRLDATDEEVIRAAKAVHAHDFIMRMEKGYDTEVNERGSRLSMGQRQLISFARTLLSDPKILILDEATASIDTHTEILVQQAIDVLLEDRTSFIIAHRLSTIRKADNIMVINNKGIAESGTHDELIDHGGIYKDLCDAQYRHLQAG